MKLFLDTSGLLAIFDRSDKNHQKAEKYWRGIFERRREKRELIISDYIIDETITRIRREIHHTKALEVFNILIALIDKSVIRMIWVNNEYFFKAKDIFEQYNDQEFSFTDCTSFAICKDLEIQSAFTLDKDFEIFGLTRHP